MAPVRARDKGTPATLTGGHGEELTPRLPPGELVRVEARRMAEVALQVKIAGCLARHRTERAATGPATVVPGGTARPRAVTPGDGVLTSRTSPFNHRRVIAGQRPEVTYDTRHLRVTKRSHEAIARESGARTGARRCCAPPSLPHGAPGESTRRPGMPPAAGSWIRRCP